MHNFFPKNFHQTYYSIHKFDSEELWVDNTLNVNRLSKDFKDFVIKILDKLKEQNSSNLIENIKKSFKDSIPTNVLEPKYYETYVTSSNASMKSK